MIQVNILENIFSKELSLPVSDIKADDVSKMKNSRSSKHLMIALKRHGDWVRLTVSDNGDREIEQKSGHGTGLENIKKRLELLFEMYTDVSLKRKDNATEGTVIWPYTPEGER